MTPVVALRSNPGGSDPLVTLQVYGPMPPVANMINVYAWLVVPRASGQLLLIVNAGIITILQLKVACCPRYSCTLASFTRTVKGKLPLVVGVPVIAPVVG